MMELIFLTLFCGSVLLTLDHLASLARFGYTAAAEITAKRCNQHSTTSRLFCLTAEEQERESTTSDAHLDAVFGSLDWS